MAPHQVGKSASATIAAQMYPRCYANRGSTDNQDTLVKKVCFEQCHKLTASWKTAVYNCTVH